MFLPKQNIITKFIKFNKKCEELFLIEKLKEYSLNDFKDSVFKEGIFTEIDCIKHNINGNYSEISKKCEQFSKILGVNLKLIFDAKKGYIAKVSKKNARYC